jgi:hypothetical protein
MSQPAKTRLHARRDGCGFLIGTSVFTCLFLVINGVVLTGVYQIFYPGGPPDSSHEARFVQILLFIGPVLLLFVQWTLIDLLTERWHRKRKRPQ